MLRAVRLAVPAVPVAALALLLAAPAGARAPVPAAAAAASSIQQSYAPPRLPKLPAGQQRKKFRYGPITVHAGTNFIDVGTKPAPKPKVDGFVTRIQPNMTFRNGRVPRTDIMHLHHAVWLNLGQRAGGLFGSGSAATFFASGEEKTIFQMPKGTGYAVRGSDTWILNYMIHNYTAQTFKVYIDYTMDFIPKSSALGKKTKALFPVWMDVEGGRAYPVYDVLRGSGGRAKRITFPDGYTNPYPNARRARNEYTVPQDMTLVTTAGHLHPGGLWDDLEVVRPGASVARHGGGPIPGGVPNSVRLFRSKATYFDPNGPVSWDMAMTGTPSTWRARVKKGDKLRISATYDTTRANWYESMGIMVVYASLDAKGVDPFTTALPQKGIPTHGQYPENQNYGGRKLRGVPDFRRLPNGRAPGNEVDIKGYRYLYGGWSEVGKRLNPPTVKIGQSLTFRNLDALSDRSSPLTVPHTITGCRQPCTGATGISYPLANGGPIDSAQLALGPYGLTAASNQLTWSTPKTLAPGTYTYYCRMHPFMRGAFRVSS